MDVKFAVIALLLLCTMIDARANIGEKYEEIEKRLGKAPLQWAESFGVMVYYHGPKTIPMPTALEQRVRSHAPDDIQQRLREGIHQSLPEVKKQSSAVYWENYLQLHKQELAQKHHEWLLVYVVEGVCLAEEYFAINWEEALKIIQRQRDGKGLGEPKEARGDVSMRDWTTGDGYMAHYSAWHRAVMVIHPQWQGVPLKQRLSSPSMCILPLSPLEKTNRELLREGKPWAIKEPELDLTPVPPPDPDESSDSLLLPQ